MKTYKMILGVLSFVFMFSSFVNAQTARLQVIHNSADIAAKSVDVYLNDKLLLKDFMFRQATPFIDAPAGTEFTVGVAPANSMSVNDVIAKFNLKLDSGKTYVAIANGVLDTSKYSPNPDKRSTAFTLFIKDMAREKAMDMDKVEFFVLHGSTDAPAVDIYARGAAKIVSNAAYGDMTDYAAVPPAKYTLDITPANSPNTIVTSVEADLTSLKGGAAVVFASGFLDSSKNQNGNSFSVLAALPDGSVIKLPTAAAPTDVKDTRTGTLDYKIEQNYPNPFNPSTVISYSIPKEEFVSIKIYNILGREVASLVNQKMAAGSYEVPFNAANLTAGTYLYSINAGNYTETRKMMYLK